VGLLLALVLTPPGRALLARNVEQVLAGVLRGDVHIGRITGSFLRDLHLERVEIRDTSGRRVRAGRRGGRAFPHPLAAGKALRPRSRRARCGRS
jgi:autotransporter translocation and assembly factor TamB